MTVGEWLLLAGAYVLGFSLVVWPLGSLVVWVYRKFETWQGRYR